MKTKNASLLPFIRPQQQKASLSLMNNINCLEEKSVFRGPKCNIHGKRESYCVYYLMLLISFMFRSFFFCLLLRDSFRLLLPASREWIYLRFVGKKKQEARRNDSRGTLEQFLLFLKSPPLFLLICVLNVKPNNIIGHRERKG